MWRASCSNTPTHFNNITRLIRTLSVVSSEKKINGVWLYFLSFHNSPSIKYCLKCVLTDASVENSGDVEGFLMKQEIMTELRKSTWLSAWNLAFSAFFSPQSCMLCVKIFNMNRYISKSYTTQRPRLQLTDNIQRGGRWSVNYYWLRACIVCVEQHSRKLSKSCIELECMPFLSIKDSKPPRTHALGSDSLYYNKNTETQDHKTVRGSGGMGKFVSALCLQSCFWNLLAYAINCVYTRGVVLLGLNLQNLSLSDCLLKLLWPSAIL